MSGVVLCGRWGVSGVVWEVEYDDVSVVLQAIDQFIQAHGYERVSTVSQVTLPHTVFCCV